MAGKKGAQMQLQTELNNDEDFDTFVLKKGLLVLDVYSDWCGPCTGMISLLRKIKIEIGGDNLNYAIAKSDTISYLARFRNKSEPTWMFVSKGQVTRVLFGANTPLLHEALLSELEKEVKFQETGTETRTFFDFTSLSPEEQLRFDEMEKVRMEKEKLEQEELARKKREKREKLLNELASNFMSSTVIVYWPQSMETGPPLIVDALDPQGMRVANLERSVLPQDVINEWVEYADFSVTEEAITALCEKKSLVQLIKVIDSDEYTGVIEKDVTEIVYGATGLPPGDSGSIAEKLFWQNKIIVASKSSQVGEVKNPEEEQQDDEPSVGAEPETVNEDEDVEEIFGDILPGIWTPLTAMAKACVVLTIFPNLCKQFLQAEVEDTPPCLAVAFDSLKKKEVVDYCGEHPDDIIRYGFFTSHDIEKAELKAKTLEEYEEKTPVITDKIVVQVVKVKSDTVLNLMSLGPVYISPNIIRAEKELAVFFPDNYDANPDDENAEEGNDESKIDDEGTGDGQADEDNKEA